MNENFDRFYEIESEPLDITTTELANLLDAGIKPTEVDRLRFTRWRLHSHQLDGDGWPHSRSNQQTKNVGPMRSVSNRGSH